MKFKLLVGSHIAGSRTFTKGQVVQSDIDLSAKFGGKFVRVDRYAEPAAVEPAVEPAAEPAATPAAAPATPANPEPAPKMRAAKPSPAKGRKTAPWGE